MTVKLKWTFYFQCLFSFLFSINTFAQPPGATNQQKLEYMKTHGMGDKIPAKSNDNIAQYANKESFVPYTAKLNLKYTIVTSHDTTIVGEENEKSHSFGSSTYTCNVNAVCDSMYAQIRTVGNDIYYDFNWNDEEKGKFKDKKFVITGGANYQSSETLNSYSDYVLYNNQKEHNLDEKWNLNSVSFEQNPTFNFTYEITEEKPKAEGALDFAFVINKAVGSGEKLEDGNRTDLIGNSFNASFTRENYLAGILQAGLNYNALQGNLSNKGTETYAITSESAARMIASDASIQKVKNGFTLDKSSTVNYKNGNVSIAITYHVSVSLLQESKYEAVLFPVDKNKYKTWIPEGPKINEKEQVEKDAQGIACGNRLDFQIMVWDKKTHQPAVMPWKARFFFTEASKNSGWCMNYPSQKLSDKKPDLRFNSTDPNAIYEHVDETELITKNTVQDKTITVISYDYGSYGKLNADVTLEDGTKLETHVIDQIESEQAISIPLDGNYNDIADQWEKNQGIFDLNYPPNEDNESIGSPNTNRGDGITLYEEYRGFVIKKDNALKRIQLNIKRQELLLCLKSKYKEEVDKAVSYFSKNSNIDVIDIGDDQLLELVPGENISSPYATHMINRWANFNRTNDGKHSSEHELCCISIIDYPKKANVLAKSVLLKPESSYNDQKISPHNFWAVIINYDDLTEAFTELKKYLPPTIDFSDSSKLEFRYSQAFYESVKVLKREFNTDVDMNTLSSLIDSRLDALTRQLMIYALTHELCHIAGNIIHHSDDNRFKNESNKYVRPYVDESLPSFSSSIPSSTNQNQGIAWLATGDPNCYTHYFVTPRFAHYITLAIIGKWDMGSNIGANGKPLFFCKESHDRCYQRLNLVWKQ